MLIVCACNCDCCADCFSSENCLFTCGDFDCSADCLSTPDCVPPVMKEREVRLDPV